MKNNWYTFAPKNFSGEGRFWDRDTGMLCKGLEAIGKNPKAVLLGSRRTTDSEKILRTNQMNASLPEWWQSLDIEGVIMHSWGNPIYEKYANAILTSGTKLIQVTDSHGIFTSKSDSLAYKHAQSVHYWHLPEWQKRVRSFMSQSLDKTWAQIYKNPKIFKMMSKSTLFCPATPAAVTRYQKFSRSMGGKLTSPRIELLPFPVNESFMSNDECEKEDKVITIGRWSSPQKRVELMCESLRIAAKQRDSTEFHVFGRPNQQLEKWHKFLPNKIKKNIFLRGFIDNEKLANEMKKFRVMYVTSAYEGCHISSAEAVCSGLSVVGYNSPFLSAIQWHTEKNSGRLSERNDPESMAQTLINELESWDKGARCPFNITSSWREVFRPSNVVRKAVELAR